MTVTLVALPVVFSQMASRWWLRGVTNRWLKRIRQAADFILGISPIVLINLIVAEICLVAGIIQETVAAWAVIAVSVVVSLYGIMAAVCPIVKRINVKSGNLGQPLRLVQITDVHIGSRSPRFLEKVITKVNSIDPDLLCITGDFIDDSGVPEKDLASLRRLRCPVYFSIGNHERYEDLEKIVERLSNLGVIVLRNIAVMHRHDVQIIGIDDCDDVRQVERQLQQFSRTPSGFNILMYHRPVGLEAASEWGVDLMLSGHTHNGQIFPFGLIVSRVFDKIVGLYECKDTQLYVSQGTGTWGPVMRIGTFSEVTLFEMECLK